MTNHQSNPATSFTPLITQSSNHQKNVLAQKKIYIYIYIYIYIARRRAAQFFSPTDAASPAPSPTIFLSSPRLPPFPDRSADPRSLASERAELHLDPSPRGALPPLSFLPSGRVVLRRSPGSTSQEYLAAGTCTETPCRRAVALCWVQTSCNSCRYTLSIQELSLFALKFSCFLTVV